MDFSQICWIFGLIALILLIIMKIAEKILVKKGLMKVEKKGLNQTFNFNKLGSAEPEKNDKLGADAPEKLEPDYASDMTDKEKEQFAKICAIIQSHRKDDLDNIEGVSDEPDGIEKD